MPPSQQLTCRFRVNKAEYHDDEDADNVQPDGSATLFDLKDCPEVGIDVREKWVLEVVKCFGTSSSNPNSIRPWDFLGNLDGSVRLLPVSAPAASSSSSEESNGVYHYPARFQIPPATIRDLNHDEKVKRTEKFAMASLLYEILSDHKPFEEVTDGREVQERFSHAVFPDDAKDLPSSLLIYSGWSEEFSQEVATRGNMSRMTFFILLKSKRGFLLIFFSSF